MKNSMVGIAFLLTACGSVEYGDTLRGSAPPPPAGALQQAGLSITIELFYEQLTPYGQWVDAPQLGRAFVPHDPNYRPYRNGHWARSGADVVCVSYDAIGWAVCHYGSWAVLDDGRWAWIPDTEWAPAWVEWRESEGYVGWAPRMAYLAPDISAQVAWVFIETAFLLTDYVAQYFVGDTHFDHVYESSPSMARAPDRGWLIDRDVRPARAVSAGVRRGPRTRGQRATARGTRVRDGVSRATARSASVRGPAGSRDGLTEPVRVRPRETVVLGVGRVRRPRPSVMVTPTSAGPSGPPLVLHAPASTPRPHPAARAPRIVTPQPRIVTPQPRIVTAPSPTHRAIRRPPARVVRPAPRPMFVQRRAPRHVAPRVSRPQPRMHVSRPRPSRSQPRVRTARAVPRPSIARSRPQARHAAPSRPTTTRRATTRSPSVGVRGMSARPR